ncbi:MAG: hypothetical protein AAF658_18925, partial [Myxococcota bacterium]
ERQIGVVFGPPIREQHVAALTEGRPRREAHRLLTQLTEMSVHALRDRGSYRLADLIGEIRAELPAVENQGVTATESDSSNAVRAKRSVRRRARNQKGGGGSRTVARREHQDEVGSE